ncbi:hypothetical protein G3O08_18095 [Cryomorpha ignava]|uniref:Uncharacterized protein n=1 Tax=Cryomorpha ignava TaxID=101383 RepID=A0A7K3WX37_9FLAO|nr:hypothetical protein [Cryomorpha ignava]NEN25412.1 hypothetical protein [Cryomorpha ignava]
MTYDQEEKFKELIQYISTHTINKDTNRIDQKAKDEDLKWNASLFLAKSIHLAEIREQELIIEQFNQFKKDYELRSETHIDTSVLFQKDWLRNILGIVKIAGTVSSACYEFKKISDYYYELDFIFNYLNKNPDASKNLTRELISHEKERYEADNDLSLNIEWTINQLTPHRNNNNEKALEINPYYSSFLSHWEEFKFLSAYKDRISSSENKGLKIAKKDLGNLHKSFKQFYSKTPSIATLIGQKLFKAEGGFYYLDLHNVDISYWSTLGDPISAGYWQCLVEDISFINDEDRVKKFLHQIFYFGWHSDFLNHTTAASKKRFLDAACTLLIVEPDLNGIDSEFKKVSIDGSFGSSETRLLFHDREVYDDFTLNNTDHFELFESLDNWEEKANTTFLYGQRSREDITFLIKVIITHDYEVERKETKDDDNPEIHYYKIVFKLLEESLTKPFLFWNIKCFVIMCRREFIPHLIKHSSYTSLAFQFIDRIGEYLPHEDKEKIHKVIWVKSIELAIYTIRSVVQKGIASKLIFQIFRQLNSKKYNIPYNRQKLTENLSRKEREEKEKAVLNLIEDSPLHNQTLHGGSGRNQFLIPELFNELTKLFIDLLSKPKYNNGTISFPMLQWDGISWLMKCGTYWKYKTHFEINPPDVDTLTNSFFQLYIDRIEVTEIKKYNFFEMKEEKGLPLWSEKIERLEYIEWIYPIYWIHAQGNLGSFLSPKFPFKTSIEEDYREWNGFVIDKLRTHIGVLLQVLRQLVIPSIPFGLERAKLQEIKLRIEQQIIDYLNQHIKNIPGKGRVDLFNYNKERAFQRSEKEALLPQVARALNWFSKKEQIIQAIIETQDIVKILTIAKWITSAGVKNKLIEKIKQSDIKTFLEETHWIPEIQQALLEISNYPQLILQINQVVEFWKKKVSKKSREYEIQLYQTKMLLAYFDNDEERLDTINEPDSRNHSPSELSNGDYKQFYRGLLRLKDSPEFSYSIFSKLSMKYPQYDSLALNRMAAKINIADESKDLKIYKEALEEWEVYALQVNINKEEDLGSTFITNKLYILLKQGDYDELDSFYSKLEMPYQMLPDVLTVKVESLIGRERKKIEEASVLLEEAENYHQFLGAGENEFIEALKVKVGDIDDVELLISYYSRIFNSSPEKLIEILPQDLNGQRQLQTFIMTEIAGAAKMMLDKIVSLSDIKSEDKYNDVIQLLLNAKMNPWGWFITDQSRGGYSDSQNKSKKRQPGERDLKISNKKGTFSVCEAFIYRRPATAKRHLKKIFDYYHQRDNLHILIYDLGDSIQAGINWTKYLNSILPETDYPNEFKYISSKDVSIDFGHKNSAIKIAQSIHEGDMTLYHIFVNLNYNVNN